MSVQYLILNLSCLRNFEFRTSLGTSLLHFTRKSDLYDLLNRGDAVIMDKGFIHIKNDLVKICLKLYCPPFKTKAQLTNINRDFYLDEYTILYRI